MVGTKRTASHPYIIYRGFTRGQLTYVGITAQDLGRRCRQHRKQARIWAWNIQQMRFRRTFTRAEAVAIEQTLMNYEGRRINTLNKNHERGSTPKSYGPLYNLKDELPAVTDPKKYCEGIKLGHIMIRSHGDLAPGTSRGDAANAYNKFRTPGYPRRNCG